MAQRVQCLPAHPSAGWQVAGEGSTARASLLARMACLAAERNSV